MRIERVRGGTFHPTISVFIVHTFSRLPDTAVSPSGKARGFDPCIAGSIPATAARAFAHPYLFSCPPYFWGGSRWRVAFFTSLCFFPQQKAVRLGLPPHPLCRHRPMVGHRPSKPGARVRSPLPAPSPWAGPPVGSPDTSLSLMFGLFLYAAFSRSSGRPTNPGKRKEMIL